MVGGVFMLVEVFFRWVWVTALFQRLKNEKDNDYLPSFCHKSGSKGSSAQQPPPPSAVSRPTSHLLLTMTVVQARRKAASDLLTHLLVSLFSRLVCHRVVVLNRLHNTIESCCNILARVSGCYGSRTRQQRQIKADSSGNENSALFTKL